MQSGIKGTIVSRTIEQDQEAVADIWAKTFHHNQMNTPTEITRMVMACIAGAQFEVRTDHDAKFSAPANVLTIADYLSHASRIMIDFRELNATNRERFLNYFPVGIETCITKRPATHDLHLDMNDSYKEGKGFLLGVKGFISHAFGYDIYDHGMDIAMGGLGQNNLVGMPIAEDGTSGHVYFHLKKELGGLMIGLEQTSPHGGVDQFGQGHSMLGASDIFTAAGSVYFDNEIYKAKLLLQKQALPPRKYEGMRIKINDSNFKNVIDYLVALKRAATPDEIKALLLQKPGNAVERPPVDFTKLNLERIGKDAYQYLVRDDDSLDQETKHSINDWLLERTAITLKELFAKQPEHPFVAIMAMRDQLATREIVAQRGAEFQRLRQQYLHAMHDKLQGDCRKLIRTINNICNNLSEQTESTNDQHSIAARLNQVKDQLEQVRDKKVTVEDEWQFIEVDSDDVPLTEEIIRKLETVTIEAHDAVEALTASKPATPPGTISLQDEMTLKTELSGAKVAATKLSGENKELKLTLEYNERQYAVSINALNKAVDELKASNDLLKAEIVRLEKAAEQNAINLIQLQTEKNALSDRLREPALVVVQPAIINEKRRRDTENLNGLIYQLSALAKRLPQPGAGEEAIKLVSELDQARINFITSNESDDKAYQTFQQTCQQALAKPKELYQHTEAKQILLNILLAIVGLGVIYGVALLVNKKVTGNWLFFNNIDNTRKALTDEVGLSLR